MKSADMSAIGLAQMYPHRQGAAMVSLPRTCPHCRRSIVHYGRCRCPDARLEAIDAERKAIERRQDELDALEREVLGLRPVVVVVSTP